MDYQEFVANRVAQLRQEKGSSARDMSLTIGQNVNYINAIENRRMEPSLTGLFFICEYLGVTPQEFFDTGNRNPGRLNALIELLKRLDENEIRSLTELFTCMLGRENRGAQPKSCAP